MDSTYEPEEFNKAYNIWKKDLCGNFNVLLDPIRLENLADKAYLRFKKNKRLSSNSYYLLHAAAIYAKNDKMVEFSYLLKKAHKRLNEEESRKDIDKLKILANDPIKTFRTVRSDLDLECLVSDN